MQGNFYKFFKTETEDGIDYLFYTPNGRIYSVSFDMSVYGSQVENFPTLLQHGYGLIFKYEQSIPKASKIVYNDTKVGVTIAKIVEDFLKEDKGAFIIYECPDYKHSKLFCNWHDELLYPDFFHYGVQVELYGTATDDFFGFITLNENPSLNLVLSEVENFFLSL